MGDDWVGHITHSVSAQHNRRPFPGGTHGHRSSGIRATASAGAGGGGGGVVEPQGRGHRRPLSVRRST
eukprot:43277-Eustigmatos_ZCMA.PRE.1